MSESFVQVAPDSTGKQIDAFQIPNGNYRQSVVVADPSANANVANVTENAGVGSLNVAAFDGTGAAINSLSAGAGQNGLMVAFGATNYVFSTLNSSTAQLAGGATFPGSIETALNQPAISLLLTSDQPILLTVYQYIDVSGTFSVPPISFTVPAGTGFSRSFELNGNYLKVTAQNLNASITTTTFNLNTAYGVITAADATGNMPVAIYGADGVQVGTDVYSGVGFLHVDTSNASTDGAVYSSSTVPQVGVVAGKGSDGKVHVLATDGNGYLGVTDAGQSLTVDTGKAGFPLDVNVAAPLTPMQVSNPPSDDPNGQPLYVTTSGSSNINAVISPVPLQIRQDVNNAVILSDAPAPYNWTGSVGAWITIDTTGYQSLNITTQAAAGTVTASDDQQTWSALSGAPRVLGALTSSLVASTGYSFPVVARYIKITLTTAGSLTAYLRNTPWVGNYQSSPTMTVGTFSPTAAVNVSQVLGVAASASNPVPAYISTSSAAVSNANALPVGISQGGAASGMTNPIPVILSSGGAGASGSQLDFTPYLQQLVTIEYNLLQMQLLQQQLSGGGFVPMETPLFGLGS